MKHLCTHGWKEIEFNICHSRVDVTIALKEILKLNGVVESLQNMKVPGAGYLYPVFLRFGLIRRKGESDGHLSDMDNIQ